MATILIKNVHSFDLKKAMDERKLIPGYKRFSPLFITFCILAMAVYAIVTDFEKAVREFSSPLMLGVLGCIILFCVVHLIYKKPEDLVLTYPKDYLESDNYKTQIKNFNSIKEIKKVWEEEAIAHNVRGEKDRSVHNQMDRSPVSVIYEEPSFISTNIKVPMMKFKKEKIYFFPNAIMIDDSKKQRCIDIKNQNFSSGTLHFIETEGRPRDARVVGSTWKHVNINGERDKRVKNNPEIPVCEYGKVTLSLGDNFETRYSLIISDIGKLPQVEAFLKNLIDTQQEEKGQIPTAALNKNIADEIDLEIDIKKLYAQKIGSGEIDPEKISFKDFELLSNKFDTKKGNTNV